MTQSTTPTKLLLGVLGLCLWLVFGQSLQLPPRYQIILCALGLGSIILLQLWVLWHGFVQGYCPRPTLGEQVVQVLGFVVVVAVVVIATVIAPEWV